MTWDFEEYRVSPQGVLIRIEVLPTVEEVLFEWRIGAGGGFLPRFLPRKLQKVMFFPSRAFSPRWQSGQILWLKGIQADQDGTLHETAFVGKKIP